MSTAAHLSMIRTAMTAAGGAWPKAVAKALDDHEKLPAAVAALDPGPPAAAGHRAAAGCDSPGRRPSGAGASNGSDTGSSAAAREAGGALRPVQSGKVNQYGALLFSAAAIAALVLVIVNT